MVVLFDKGVHRRQLAEGTAAQLECGVNIPRLGVGYGPSGQRTGTLMGCGQLPVESPSPRGLWVSFSDGDG